MKKSMVKLNIILVTVFVDNKEVGVDYYITTKGYILYTDKNGTEYVSENPIDISKYFD